MSDPTRPIIEGEAVPIAGAGAGLIFASSSLPEAQGAEA